MESLQATTYSLQFLYKMNQLKIATAVCEEERQPSPRAGASPGKCVPQSSTVAPTATQPPIPTRPATTTAAQTTVFHSLPNLNGECDQFALWAEAYFSNILEVEPKITALVSNIKTLKEKDLWSVKWRW